MTRGTKETDEMTFQQGNSKGCTQRHKKALRQYIRNTWQHKKTHTSFSDDNGVQQIQYDKASTVKCKGFGLVQMVKIWSSNYKLAKSAVVIHLHKQAHHFLICCIEAILEIIQRSHSSLSLHLHHPGLQ